MDGVDSGSSWSWSDTAFPRWAEDGRDEALRDEGEVDRVVSLWSL